MSELAFSQKLVFEKRPCICKIFPDVTVSDVANVEKSLDFSWMNITDAEKVSIQSADEQWDDRIECDDCHLPHVADGSLDRNDAWANWDDQKLRDTQTFVPIEMSVPFSSNASPKIAPKLPQNQTS